MADVQKENGFTPIASALLEQLCSTSVPKRHLVILLAIARKTYGWQKTADRISSSQIAEITGLVERDVRRALSELEALNMIVRSPVHGGTIRMIGIQKDFDQWREWSPTRAQAPGRRRQGNDEEQGELLDLPGRQHPGTDTRASAPPGVGTRVDPGVGARATRAQAPPTIEEERRVKKKPSVTPPAWAMNCAQHYVFRLGPIPEENLDRVPGAKIKKGCELKWAREIALMPKDYPELAEILETEGEDALEERIKAGITWATSKSTLRAESPEQRRWAVQVMCGAALREKWGQLVAASLKAKRTPEASRDAAEKNIENIVDHYATTG